MTSDLVDIFLLSLVAMFNPTLLAAVTVMLLLPNPRRLMVGYRLGAYVAAIGAGLLIVFVLPHSSATSTAKRTLDPVEDLVLGGVALAVALALRVRGRPSVQRRRRASKEAKLRARREAGKPTESMPMRMLGKGDPRLTFVVGVLLSFPGVAYLDALDHIHHLDPGNRRNRAPRHVLLRGAADTHRATPTRVPVRAGAHAGGGGRVPVLSAAPGSDRRRAWRDDRWRVVDRPGRNHAPVALGLARRSIIRFG